MRKYLVRRFNNIFNDFLLVQEKQLVNHRLICSSKVDRGYKVFTAVCVERPPIIARELTDVESRFKKFLTKIELDNSLKSDFELKLLAAKKKSKDDNEEKNAGAILDQTVKDYEEEALKELSSFKLASKETDADRDGSVQTVDRKLSSSLYLVIENKEKDQSFWVPPYCETLKTETMKEAAEKLLKETCGEAFKVDFYGEAPIYSHKYVESKDKDGKVKGAIVFYLYAKYKVGDVSTKVPYKWLDFTELDKDLAKSVHKYIRPITILT